MAPAILALDSSPDAVASRSRMASGMGGAPSRTTFKRSSESPTKVGPQAYSSDELSCIGSSPPAKRPKVDSAAPAASRPAKAFNLDLEQYRYDRKPTSAAPPSTASSSRASRDSSVEHVATVRKGKLRRRHDDDDDDVEDVSSPPTSVDAHEGAEYDVIIGRLRKLYQRVPIEEVRRAAIETKGDTSKALTLLSAYSKRMASAKASSASPSSQPLIDRRASSSSSSMTTRPPERTTSFARVNSSQTRNGSASPMSPPPLRIGKVLPKVTAKPAAKAAPPPIKQRAQTISDDDDDGSGSDASDAYDGVTNMSRRDADALRWFNSCDVDSLMDTTGCKDQAAALIMELRPFSSVDDVEEKLGDRRNKGVQPRLFHNCVELMAGYEAIDQVLARCEKMGAKLAAEIASWDSPQGPRRPELYLRQQPASLSEEHRLKSFQLRGVNWLNLLYRERCGGILADEMGTGKTFQTIAFLSHLLDRGDVRKSHLVVVPSSLLDNWEREFTRFAPHIEVVRYHGSLAERAEMRDELKARRDDGEPVEVILTTYDMAAGGEADHKFFRRYNFDACVFDEGHLLKNKKSQKYDKLKRIRCAWSVLLTGTPLQNNLGELMALLNFIMPTYFSHAQDALDRIFATTAGKPQNLLSKQRVVRAQKMLQPFVLRRRKTEVLLDLPPKTERVVTCDMLPDQKRLYDRVFARTKAMRQQALAAAAAEGGEQSEAAIKARMQARKEAGHVLMELRKAANHPLLLRDRYDRAAIEALAKDYRRDPRNCESLLEHVIADFEINSDLELCIDVAEQFDTTKKHALPNEAWLGAGKTQELIRIIKEVRAKGEKLVVFSQFVQTLRCICRALEIEDIPYRGFTGSDKVQDRQPIVDDFTNDPDIPVFLLTRKAGGVGINLTAACHVVLYDQDYNPQNDRQAADRCYRIGQERPVTITRLVSRGTIDEHILDLAKAKLLLAEKVEGGGEGEGAKAKAKAKTKGKGEGEVESEEGDVAESEGVVKSDVDVEEEVQTALLARLLDGPEESEAKEAKA